MHLPGHIAQSVTSPTADPGVASSIPAWSRTFMEIDLEMAEMPTIPIFVADFCITILNIKIAANNDFKMVPDKITGVTSTSTPVIPEVSSTTRVLAGAGCSGTYLYS